MKFESRMREVELKLEQYKESIKNNDLNCEFTVTYTLQGESLVKIYEELQRLKVSGKYLQEPEILYVYKPKSSN